MASSKTRKRKHRRPTQRDITAFWRWFASIADELADDFENPTLGRALDKRVARLGPLMWELGPGVERENAFVISPDGSMDLLPLSQRIIASAPDVASWELHWVRPPKQWSQRFEIEADSGKLVSIDARKWRYVLRSFPDGTFDILIEQGNVGRLDENTRYAAAVIVVEGILGEYKRMTLVPTIELTERLPKKLAVHATLAPHLGAHLDSLSMRRKSR